MIFEKNDTVYKHGRIDDFQPNFRVLESASRTPNAQSRFLPKLTRCFAKNVRCELSRVTSAQSLLAM